MGVYNNNKDGTRSTLANTIQVVDAPMEQFLSRGEFNAVTPNDVSADNKLVAENEVTKAVDTMPTASASLVGTIVQYVGTTTANYTNGYFYKCVSDGAVTPTYSWVVISAQTDYTELDNKPSINGQVLSGNKTSAQLNLATPREVRQFSTLNALTSYLASYVITNESLIYIRNYNTYYIITGRQSSDTEDDCIFVSDTQKLVPDIYHLENNLLNIKAFGALPSTNTIENSRLITKVINFAFSRGIGVFVSKGRWYIKETIPMRNISIIGETSSNVNVQASVTSANLIFDPEQSNISMFTDSGAHNLNFRHLTFECPYTTINRSWVEVAETPHNYITWSYQYDNVNCLDIRNSRLDIFDVNIRGFSGFGLSCNQALSIESVRIFNGKYGFYNCKTDVQFHDSFIQGCEVGFMWDNNGTVLFAYNTWIDQCKYGVYSAAELSGLFDGAIDHCLYAGIYAKNTYSGLKITGRMGRLGMYYLGTDMAEKADAITTYSDEAFDDMSKGVNIAIKNARGLDIDVSDMYKKISDNGTGTEYLPSLLAFGNKWEDAIIQTVKDFEGHTYKCIDSSSNVKVINVNSSDLPSGGTTGQVLIKSSDADYDTEWGSIGTVPIIPSETEQGTYYYKSGSGSTVTQKSDGTVDFSNDGTNYGAAFFELPVNEKCINKIKFSCTMLSGELTDGTVYINKSGTGLITLKSNLSITGSEEYEIVLTPEFLAQKELTSPIYITLATWSNVSYNIGFSNTYGVEDSILDLNLKVRERPLEGKKAIFLGDSITALTDNRSWVEKFLDITGCLKVANVAVSSARLYDYEDTVYDGDPKASVQHNNTLGNQVQKIINNQYETPDLIIIAIGTNGGITADTTRISAVYYNNGSMPPLADIDKTHSEGAFRYCTETLHNLYPNATIFWCNPIQAAIDSREIGLINSYGDNLKILTQWGAVNNVETNRCGIMSANETGQHEYLVDGLHPNEAGALKMARYNSAIISALFT